MTLNHLGAHTNGALIDINQRQKSTTSNDLDNLIADATQNYNSTTVLDLGGSPTSADITLTVDEYTATFYRELVDNAVGDPSVAFTITVPNTERVFGIKNSTGQEATIVRTGGGTSVVIPSTEAALIQNTGANLELVNTVWGTISTVTSTDTTQALLFQKEVKDNSIMSIMALGHGFNRNTTNAIGFMLKGTALNFSGTISVIGSNIDFLDDAGLMNASPAEWSVTFDVLNASPENFVQINVNGESGSPTESVAWVVRVLETVSTNI